jgi:hypothetical protein
MVQSVKQRISASWRPVGGTSFRVADASRFVIDGIDDLMDEPWFSEVRWVVPTPGLGANAPADIRMVQTGPVGTVDRLVVGLLSRWISRSWQLRPISESTGSGWCRRGSGNASR